MVIRIFVVDDHQQMRQEVCQLLNKEADFEVIGEFADGTAALCKLVEQKPTVVVTDIIMPHLHGIELTRRITTHFPGIKVIGLSLQAADKNYVDAMRKAGAVGYVYKENLLPDLFNAIRTAAAEGTFF